MTMSTFTLRFPPALKAEAARLAKLDGVSLKEWIVAAVIEKIAVAQAVSEMSEARTLRTRARARGWVKTRGLSVHSALREGAN